MVFVYLYDKREAHRIIKQKQDSSKNEVKILKISQKNM